jgi:hypothetical protein
MDGDLLPIRVGATVLIMTDDIDDGCPKRTTT